MPPPRHGAASADLPARVHAVPERGRAAKQGDRGKQWHHVGGEGDVALQPRQRRRDCKWPELSQEGLDSWGCQATNKCIGSKRWHQEAPPRRHRHCLQIHRRRSPKLFLLAEGRRPQLLPLMRLFRRCWAFLLLALRGLSLWLGSQQSLALRGLALRLGRLHSLLPAT